MRDRSKRRTCIAPKLRVKKKPEIDRILEEVEAHMPKKAKCLTIPKGQSVQTYTARCNSSDFISSCNKESLVAFLWRSIEANIEGLKTLMGEEYSLTSAAQRIEISIEDWRKENAVE